MSIKIIGPKDKHIGEYINTTSKSNNWSKGLSPFFLGPCELYDSYKALNVENAWQYNKGMTLQDVLNEPKLKMGHAFVLAMLLEEKIIVDKNEVIFNF